MKLLIAIGAIGFSIGAVAGVGAAGEAKTVTRTVARATPPRTIVQTKTIIKTKVPSACKAAISAARQIAGVVGEFAGTAAKYPEMVTRAAVAGSEQNSNEIETIARESRSIDSSIEADAGKVGGFVDQFNSAATGCKQ